MEMVFAHYLQDLAIYLFKWNRGIKTPLNNLLPYLYELHDFFKEKTCKYYFSNSHLISLWFYDVSQDEISMNYKKKLTTEMKIS